MVAADDAFRTYLGLPSGEATELLRARAAADPVLAALLSGEGPDSARVDAGDGAPADVLRSACDGGFFLRARPAGGLPAPALEHAMHSLALARLASGVAHDVKNPLNAMALQLALLSDKIGAAGDDVAAACAGHLASLKNQIGRVNDVVRRLADVSDPPPGDVVDLGGLADDVATLFGHESRRRGVALTCEAARGVVSARGDAARTARVLLGLFWRALARPEQGGRMSVRVSYDAGDALLALEHGVVADPALAWIPAVARRAVSEAGGRFVHTKEAALERLELRFRRENAS